MPAKTRKKIVNPNPKVAIHIKNDYSLNRAKVDGILRFMRRRPGWEIPMTGYFPYLSLEDLMTWEGDGVIGNFNDPEFVRALQARGLQVVSTSASLRAVHNIPTVCQDSKELGALAARHLLERRAKNFCFIGFESHNSRSVHFEDRGQAFADELRSRGFPCELFWAGLKQDVHEVLEAAPWRGLVKGLKLPVAVFACADHAAFGFMKACAEAGLQIPREVCVLGVDDDAMLCQLSRPQLSSIDARGEEIGYRAAEMLETLMLGDKPPSLRHVVAPGEVRLRVSTDLVSTEHMEVAAAIRFINTHAREPIHVGDLLRAIPTISRRSLERHFKAQTGMSLHGAIRRAHLNIACDLLKTTTLTLDQIAHQSGFKHVLNLNTACEAVYGKTASELR